jgi:hypothetical protein
LHVEIDPIILASVNPAPEQVVYTRNTETPSVIWSLKRDEEPFFVFYLSISLLMLDSQVSFSQSLHLVTGLARACP